MASTALLVIDMQNAFASMTTTALPHIESLIRRFRAQALPVIFTQLTGPPYSNQLVQRWGPDGSIRTGSHDWELQAPILELVGEAPVVAKNTYDAFINTNLEALLKDAGVT